MPRLHLLECGDCKNIFAPVTINAKRGDTDCPKCKSRYTGLIYIGDAEEKDYSPEVKPHVVKYLTNKIKHFEEKLAETKKRLEEVEK